MSSIYNLEPPPTGAAIIHTTLGEIALELFAKQTPLTCRNFLQLALDGYYDDTIFHRLVPGFILQGGDPTGTGNGGESIYDGGAYGGDLDPWPMDERRGRNAGPQGINFKDEFHSRLKLNRRGLLAMANEGRPDTNGSQFFFTLDKTEELNGKNTLFGRVAGDTIYNLMKIGESEMAEGTERPLYPVKILKIEVTTNPFEDMRKRERVATKAPKKATVDKAKKKRKGGKQLLSFGDEEGEGDEDVPVFKKPKFDTRIIAEEESTPATTEKPQKTKKKPAEKQKTNETNDRTTPGRKEDDTQDDGERTQRPGRDSRKKKPSPSTDEDLSDASDLPEPKMKTALEKANEEMAALKASMRRTVHAEQPEKEKKKSALASMIPDTSTRGARKRNPGQSSTTAMEDQRALRLLKAMQSRLSQAPPEKEPEQLGDGGETEKQAEQGDEAELCDLHFIANCQSCTSWDKQPEEDTTDEGWLSHTLSFAADKLGKDLTNRRKAEEELVVIDPREKSRTLKESKKTDSRGGRAWDQTRDQARNAKLSRAAALAGRGAK